MFVRHAVLTEDFTDNHSTVQTDPALRITAPVGDGGPPRCANQPDDVRKVQTALNRFRPFDGGPLNPLVVDGLCGPLTRGAIRRFQEKLSMKNVDGIVDPEGPTMRELRLGPAPGNPGDAPAQFLALLPRVIGIVTAAQASLTAARAKLTIPNALAGKESLESVKKHFVRNALPSALSTIEHVQRVYLAIQTAIGHLPQGRLIAADEPPTSSVGAIMFSFPGAMDHPKDPVTGKPATYKGLSVESIYLCPAARRLPEEQFTYAMIHELAHYVSDTKGIPYIDDINKAYFHRHPDRYRALSNFEALRNADCYSQFAFQAIGRPDFKVN